jgi:hypothetical protein
VWNKWFSDFPKPNCFPKREIYFGESVAAHEIIHDVAYSDQSGFLFKLDYEKAYDRVDRSVLLKMMQSRALAQDE